MSGLRCETWLFNLGTSTGTILLGTVIAATGWLVSHVVDSVISVPTVEYEISKSKKERVEVTMRNLSRNHKFGKLSFVLYLKEPKDETQHCPGFTEDGARIVGIAPGYPSTNKQPNIVARTVTYEFDGFHPETAVILTADYNCNYSPSLHIKQSSDTARLVEKGGKTWIIRHEILLYLVLLVLWTILVTWAIYKLPAGKR